MFLWGTLHASRYNSAAESRMRCLHARFTSIDLAYRISGEYAKLEDGAWGISLVFAASLTPAIAVDYCPKFRCQLPVLSTQATFENSYDHALLRHSVERNATLVISGEAASTDHGHLVNVSENSFLDD